MSKNTIFDRFATFPGPPASRGQAWPAAANTFGLGCRPARDSVVEFVGARKGPSLRAMRSNPGPKSELRRFRRHREDAEDTVVALDCFASLAMTAHGDLRKPTARPSVQDPNRRWRSRSPKDPASPCARARSRSAALRERSSHKRDWWNKAPGDRGGSSSA
jgi:hypothetical protein